MILGHNIVCLGRSGLYDWTYAHLPTSVIIPNDLNEPQPLKGPRKEPQPLKGQKEEALGNRANYQIADSH